MYLRMCEQAPVEVRHAGISYRVEPAEGDVGEATHIVARPLTAAGDCWTAHETVQLSERLPPGINGACAWNEGFKVNDTFLAHALTQQILADKAAEEVDALPHLSPLDSR